MTNGEWQSRNLWDAWHAFWERDRGAEAPGDESDDLVALWLRAKGRNRALSMVLTYSDPLGRYRSEG